jgi:hypothetical protein
MAHIAEHVEIGHAISGNFRALTQQNDQSGILVPVHNATPEVLEGLARSIELVGQLYSEKLAPVSAEVVAKIVEMFVPKTPAPSTVLLQAKMMAQAKNTVLQSGDWITASDITELANFSTANPSTQPSKWKREKRLFAIRHDGIDYFPIYGLDENTGYRPYAALKEIIAVLAACKDGWGMAYWFASLNGRLDARAPKDVLRSDAERVLAAAKIEVAGITHG